MKIKATRGLSLASYLGLIAFGMAWAIALGDVPRQQISMTLLYYAPLLIPLRGILHGRDKAILWGVLISLLYLIHGGTIAWADDVHRWWGLLESFLVLGYLFSASLFIRWRAEAAAQA